MSFDFMKVSRKENKGAKHVKFVFFFFAPLRENV
jgi:hypothetical protein